MAERGDVVKRLDEGMWETILAAKSTPADRPSSAKAARSASSPQAQIWKRYSDYARGFAVKVLSGDVEKRPAKGIPKGLVAHDAEEVATEAMFRLLYGAKPAIQRYVPGESSLATYIGSIVKNVAYERGRRTKRETSSSATTGQSMTTIEDTLADEGNLDPEEAALQRQEQQEVNRLAAAQGQAIGAAAELLKPDELAILQMRMRTPPKSYKEMAADMFPGEDLKKATQKVMVRLYRARKKLETESGIPLRGLVGVLGKQLGPDARGRPRKNPEDGLIYAEDVNDLNDLLECGIIDEAVYEDCMAAMGGGQDVSEEEIETYDILPLEIVEAFEELARGSGASRSFLAHLRREGGVLTNQSWIEKRHGFIDRQMAQLESSGEDLFEEDGTPSSRHLALIMWGYSPDPDAVLALVD